MRFLSRRAPEDASGPPDDAEFDGGPDRLRLLHDGRLLAKWFIEYRLKQEVDRAKRYDRPLSVLIAVPTMLLNERLTDAALDAAVSAAVLISLLEAVTITPMRTAALLGQNPKPSRFENYLDTNLKSIRPRIDTKYNPSASFYTLLWQSSPSVVSTTTGTTRFYVNGTGELHITRNARWDGALWNRDILSEATLLEIGSGEFFFRRQNFNAVPWANGAWTQIILGGDLDGVFTQGLGITADANGSMDPNFARFNAPFNFNTGDATGNRLQVLRAYDSSDSLGFHEYAHAFNAGFDFEKTIGCHWNHANNSWEQDNALAGAAVCWRFGNGAMARFMKNPPIDSWFDTQWTSCDRAFAEIIIANGEPTIVAGFNIASITNISATSARINFTTPLPSDNYIVLTTSIGNAFDVITPTVRLTTFVEIQPARSSFPGNLVFGNFTTQNWRFSISMQAT